jgi:hypothetical protein
MGERVAIVGSRDYPDKDEVFSYVTELPADTVVVSGGARGVDLAAESCAGTRGLTVVSYRPVKVNRAWRVSRLTARGYASEQIWLPAYFATFVQAAFFRNVQIVADCDRVVAFWDGRSRGTKSTIDIAGREGKPVEIWCPNEVEAS